jgi:CDP-diacylglycerol--glycerol-3-phosphate 3-phosphatidyltransferase
MTLEKKTDGQPAKDKIITVSNLLSLSRIVIVIPIVYLLHLGNTDPVYNLAAFGVMILGGLTDTFDGLLARKMNQITNFGKVADPVADKIGMGSILAFLAISRVDFPAWFFILALVRDILIFSAGLYIKKKYNYLFTSNMLGKLTVVVVALMIMIYVVKEVFHIEGFYIFLLWLSTILIFTSFCVYAIRLWKFLNQKKTKDMK